MRSPHHKSIDPPERELQEAYDSIKNEDALLTVPHELENLLLEWMRAQQKRSHSFQSKYWIKAAAAFVIVLLGGAIWIFQPESRHNFRPEINKSEDEGYLPLTYGFTPDESLQRIRVKLPRSALDQFGIRMDNDSRTREVTADLLVGESGLPYAVRVIQKN
jgi:hypothetical protein